MKHYGRIGGFDTRPLNHYGFLRGANGLHHSFGADYAEIGVTAEYGAVMQFGAKKGSFGPYSGINKKGHPFSGVSPWGDIPARPFIGISEDDSSNIMAIISEWLEGVLE